MGININWFKYDAQKVIIPSLNFDLQFQLTDDERDNEHLRFISMTSTLTSGGRFISSAPNNYMFPYGNQNSFQLQVSFPLYREVVQYLEENRQGDLNLEVRLDFLCHKTPDQRITQLNCFENIKLSQADWNEVLEKIGFSNNWVLEIRNPQIEGFEGVIDILKDANQSLINHSYGDCVYKLRTAWKKTDQILSPKLRKLLIAIDENSQGEDNQPSKSARIETLKNAILKVSHMGAHQESYNITHHDAELNYYQSVSLISYLSKFLDED